MINVNKINFNILKIYHLLLSFYLKITFFNTLDLFNIMPIVNAQTTSTTLNTTTDNLNNNFTGNSPMVDYMYLNYTNYTSYQKLNPTNNLHFEEKLFFIPNCSYIQIHFDFRHIPSTSTFFTYLTDWEVKIII